MDNVKLTDFTRAELQVLLNAIVLYDRFNDRGDEKETILLWQTQVLYAIGKIGMQETINNN